MNKDLFALVPNTFEPSLNENYADIEKFLELEYHGQMTAELKSSLADKNQVTVIPKLLTSITMAAVLFLAACTPASSASADNQQSVPYAEGTPSPAPKKTPTQLVISGMTQLSSLNRGKRIEVDLLVFEDWARLQTGGEDVEIIANTIIAKSGLIRNDDLGGHLKLYAKNMFGSLNIEATGTVSHPGTLDVVIENMDWLSDQGYGCGIGGRYNTEGNGHTSSFVIKNNHCWKERLSMRQFPDSSSFTAF